MIKIKNKKQIFMIFISLILILMSYYLYNSNYINSMDNKVSDIENYPESTSLGDATYVSTQNVYSENSVNDTEKNNVIEEKVEKKDNYFEDSRMERDKMYAETLEVYENILSNDGMSEEQKMIAENEITVITNTKNAIMIAENLIKVKGFEDVIIFVNDGYATVVVKSDKLKKEHIAQIQNIVSSKLSIEPKDISITNRSK